jgi:large subunit ribosomal protein L29
MKVNELINMSEKDLISQLGSFKKEAMNLRFSKASGSLQNTARMRVVKRTIARINTIISQKNNDNKMVKK